jgi:PadR family transcriptional regulator, regulatory protein PadR
MDGSAVSVSGLRKASASAVSTAISPQLPIVAIYWYSMSLSSGKRAVSKQATEMLKGTLEGIVLALLSRRPAYGYEITAWLREQGFSDIAEGTVYALLIRIEQRGLVDVEKVPSEKGPPRKVYSLNAQGREYLEEFWRTWSFLSERVEQLHEGGK